MGNDFLESKTPMHGTLKSTLKKKLVSPLRAWNGKISERRFLARLSFRGQEASDHIKSLIHGNAPAMICRLGTGELNSIKLYRKVESGRGRFKEEDHDGLEKSAGFFPISREMIARFYQRMIQDIQIIDVLGSWLRDERFFRHELRNAKRCGLADLEPYYHGDPWSAALAGRGC